MKLAPIIRTAIARLSNQVDGESAPQGNIQTVTSSYHFSIRPINKKAWIDINSPRFFYLQSIQYIGLVEFGTKPDVSPTYL